VRRSARVTAAALRKELSSPSPPLVLDVRGPRERRPPSIQGSLRIPLEDLARREEEIPRDRPLVLCCSTGYRASIAASLLERIGGRDVRQLIGGLAAWGIR
jgi:rhodanese-related sulfurtransferase